MKKLEILLGVTGSIAAYKALELVRLFKEQGWNVTVVMTRAAKHLAPVETFRTLSGRTVALDLFPKERVVSGSVEHIDLATRPDLVVVAPATANIIGKLAAGIADDLLSTVLLALPQERVSAGRVLLAPAMNRNMWQNPIVQENVRRLAALGYRFIGPDTGELACGEFGTGRMSSPETILYHCRAALARLPDLKGIPVLVTTGRTEEPIDPVRVITNRSSGIMGIEIARAFAAAGAIPKLIAGAVSVPLPGNALRVQTTEEMAKAVLKALPEVKILVMCAAVADYQPSTTAKKKYHQDQITLRLKSTTDILAQAAAQPNRPLLVGFSQDDSLARAKAKLRSKHLDLIVANPVKTASAQKVRATLVFASGRIRRLPEISKRDFALELVKTVAGIYQQKGDK